jgi:hypothetical protein
MASYSFTLCLEVHSGLIHFSIYAANKVARALLHNVLITSEGYVPHVHSKRLTHARRERPRRSRAGIKTRLLLTFARDALLYFCRFAISYESTLFANILHSCASIRLYYISLFLFIVLECLV